MKHFRMLLMVGLVAVWGWAFAGSASAQPGENGVPIDAPEECVEEVMDLPAMNVCKDAQGRHILDIPTMTLREPLPAKPAPKAAPSGKLPKTGMGAEDIAAIGMAAVAGGAVLLRRLRFAVS